MKKTFIIPSCKIVKLNTSDIIATSDKLPYGDVSGQHSRFGGRNNWGFEDDWDFEDE